LLRIEPKCFELPTPFRRSIAQPFDIDASGQTALDGSRQASPWLTALLARRPTLLGRADEVIE